MKSRTRNGVIGGGRRYLMTWLVPLIVFALVVVPPLNGVIGGS